MRKFLVSVMAVVCFGFVFNSVATDIYPNIQQVILLSGDQGNQFLMYTNAGEVYVVTRSRVGSLAYDQFFSLAQQATNYTTPTRKMWIAYDTIGRAAAQANVTSDGCGFTIKGVVNFMSLYAPGL
jgi:hypothetical protein